MGHFQRFPSSRLRQGSPMAHGDRFAGDVVEIRRADFVSSFHSVTCDAE
jgi:hypothetical protein